MSRRIEDEAADVLKKAQRARALTTADLAERCGCPPQAIRGAREGTVERALLDALAPALGLDAARLWALHTGDYPPAPPESTDLLMLAEACPSPGDPEMSVNAYLAFPAESDAAVLFDAGVEPERVFAALKERGRRLAALYLTHTHHDHVTHLEAYRARAEGAALWVHPNSASRGAEPLAPGSVHSYGGLAVEAHETIGHAPDGMSYHLRGLQTPVAIVGDALFAGSIGGVAPEAFAVAMGQLQSLLTALSPDTRLAPGHGQMTTVGIERAHNPFLGDAAR